MKGRDDLTKIRCGWCGEPRDIVNVVCDPDMHEWEFWGFCLDCGRLTSVSLRGNEKARWDARQRGSATTIDDTHAHAREETGDD